MSNKKKFEKQLEGMRRKNEMGNIVKYFLLGLTIITALMSLMYTLTHMTEPRFVNLILALPFILFLTPMLLMSLYGVKLVESKMKILPRFLRDVVDNVESGMDLVTSIKVTTANEYGVLNQDIKKLANHLSWGIDFDIALIEFTGNIGSKDLKRDFLLVIEARKVGGHVEKILRELSYKINNEIIRKTERKSNLSSNTFTGYISFVIFLFIIVLIYNNLFLSLGSAVDPTSTIDVEGGLEPEVNADPTTLVYLTLLMLLSYELAILSGFLFGLMQENNIISGAPHVATLVFITFLAFYFFIKY